MTNDNGKIKGDKLKLWAIIFLAVLMVFTVAAVIFGLKLPKTNREIAGGEDNFTSQTLFSEDKILVQTSAESLHGVVISVVYVFGKEFEFRI